MLGDGRWIPINTYNNCTYSTITSITCTLPDSNTGTYVPVVAVDGTGYASWNVAQTFSYRMTVDNISPTEGM